MSILFFLIALGLLIFVHELGHFVVAKRSGVYVEEFSLGFGPRIVGIKKGETDYRISALPLGGYVKMLGEDESAEKAEDPRSFARKSTAKRALIIACGPLMNVIFALAVMPLVFMIGRAEPAFLKKPPEIMGVRAESPAASAGLLKGDLITAIDGKKVSDWETVLNRVIISAGNRVDLTVLRQGQSLNKTVDVIEIPELQGGFVGIEPMLFLGNNAAIDGIAASGPAAKAGLKAKDVVLSVDGKTVADWIDLSSKVNQSAGREVALKIRRGSKVLNLKVTPEYNDEAKRWLIGIIKDRRSGVEMTTVRYGIIDSIVYGTKENIKLIALTFGVLKRLVTFNLSYKVLGGPVIIAKASAAAAASGLSHFLYFLAFLSMQLAIINCLPIPVLDGGHLMFLGIEAVRRKPVSLRIRQTASQIGFFLLIALMIVITWNDINKLFNVQAWLKKIF
jgi:regulator of sigma E protease